MKLPPPAGISLWQTIFFLFIVTLFLFGSYSAGMRGLGIAVINGANSILITQRVTYGWKGHEHLAVSAVSQQSYLAFSKRRQVLPCFCSLNLC